jgi:hypothetical protein
MMEEIKVGEYVRTYLYGIRRIDGIEPKRPVNRYISYTGKSDWDGKYYTPIRTTDIEKHSKNIIDLIEVGDYVNGERVIETHNRANDDGEKVILTENYNAWTDDGIVSNKQIKTIVTKEQFKRVMYEVK